MCSVVFIPATSWVDEALRYLQTLWSMDSCFLQVIIRNARLISQHMLIHSACWLLLVAIVKHHGGLEICTAVCSTATCQWVESQSSCTAINPCGPAATHVTEPQLNKLHAADCIHANLHQSLPNDVTTRAHEEPMCRCLKASTDVDETVTQT